MHLRINGQPFDVPDSLGDSSLVDVIRDYLGLKGTKFGCGKGLCGACTIHMNGTAVRSCLLTPKSAKNQELTTIEGLAASYREDELHPVQRAWIEKAVPQCGYCQAGQIMSAVSLLNENSHPTSQEIETAMSGNLCRCGTYQRIRAAVQRSSELLRDSQGRQDEAN